MRRKPRGGIDSVYNNSENAVRKKLYRATLVRVEFPVWSNQHRQFSLKRHISKPNGQEPPTTRRHLSDRDILQSGIAQTFSDGVISVRDTSCASVRGKQVTLRMGRKRVKCMKKVMTIAAILGMTSLGWAGTTRENVQDRLDNSGRVLHEIMDAPDKGIPEEVLEHAKCIAVVPHMLKAGFVFGADNGKGVATCRTAEGWSAPAFFDITGASWGLQIGIEGVDLVLVIQNDKGMERLLSSHFQLGADASVAAGPVGRHASADTDWKMETEILTYSRAKGLFAGISLAGSAIRGDADATEAIYGHDASTRAILRGEVAAPASARSFLNAVKDAKRQAIASN